MRARRATRLRVAVLTGAVCLLALLNFYLLQSPVDISPIAAPTDKADAPRTDSAELATALDKKTAEQFRETVGRPLFNPSRRPVQRKDAAAAGPKAEPAPLRLIGVMQLGSQPPRALLRSANDPIGKWIAEGAEFNGWKLREVKEHSVIVQAGKRTQELTLSAARRAPEESTGPKPVSRGSR